MKPWILSRRVCRFGSFEADLSSGLLTRNGTRVKMQDQPFRILAMLLERPGEIVTREMFRHQLWPNGTYVDFDGSLNVALKKLRGALDDGPDKPRFIETVPKRGYRFIAPVSREASGNGGSSNGFAAASVVNERTEEASVQIQQTVRPAGPRGRIFAAAFLLTAAVSALAIIVWMMRHRSPMVTAVASIKPIPARRSIAVLGFRNVSGGAEDAWLSTALSEMMSTELAAGDKLRLVSGEDVSNLRVSSPWSQTHTKSQATTAHIGTALNSDLLVLGSYTSVGKSNRQQIRLDVRLQDARTGEILAEVAEIGGDQNLFQLVSRIGGRVRDRLGVPNLQQSDESSVFASMPVNREAARFYALALDRLRQFDYIGGVQLLEQSLKTDSKFPLAHSMLSEAWQNLGYGQRAKDEAKKALDLSSNLSQTQKLLIAGHYYQTLGKMEDAAADYRALFAYYPDCLDCGILLSSVQIQGFHLKDALATLDSLRRLPPAISDDPRIDFNEQWAVSTYDRSRQFTLLESAAGKALARGQRLLYARAKLSACGNLSMVGRWGDAIAACEEARSVFQDLGDQFGVARALISIAAHQSDSGNGELALQTLVRALQIARDLHGSELMGHVLNGIGNVYARMGRPEQAARSFRNARKSYEESGNRSGVSATSANLGDVLAGVGSLRLADEAYQKALDIDLAANPSGGCYALYSLASLHLTTGDLRTAHARIDPALKACAAQGVARHNAYAIAVTGDILMAEADLVGAREKYQKTMEIYTKADAQDLLPGIHLSLALVSIEENHLTDAEIALREVVSKSDEHKDFDGESTALIFLSKAFQMEGKLDDARKSLIRAKQLSHSISDWTLEKSLEIQDARLKVAAASSHKEENLPLASTRKNLLSIVASARTMENYSMECNTRLALGELEMQANPPIGRSELVALSRETHERGFDLISRKATHLLSPPSKAEAKPSSSKIQ